MLFKVPSAPVAVFLNKLGDVLARSAIVTSRNLCVYVAGKRFGQRNVDCRSHSHRMALCCGDFKRGERPLPWLAVEKRVPWESDQKQKKAQRAQRTRSFRH